MTTAERTNQLRAMSNEELVDLYFEVEADVDNLDLDEEIMASLSDYLFAIESEMDKRDIERYEADNYVDDHDPYAGYVDSCIDNEDPFC